MAKDRSIVEKLADTLRDVARTATDAASEALKSEPLSRAEQRSAGYVPLAGDGLLADPLMAAPANEARQRRKPLKTPRRAATNAARPAAKSARRPAKKAARKAARAAKKVAKKSSARKSRKAAGKRAAKTTRKTKARSNAKRRVAKSRRS